MAAHGFMGAFEALTISSHRLCRWYLTQIFEKTVRYILRFLLQIHFACYGILGEIVNGIKDALENTPPELSADLVDMGLTLTGGGALLKNIDKRFSKETGLPVHIADDPLACVAIGTGKALDQEEIFSTILSEY